MLSDRVETNGSWGIGMAVGDRAAPDWNAASMKRAAQIRMQRAMQRAIRSTANVVMSCIAG